MVGGGNNGGGTGAYVALANEGGEDEAEYPATTLDQLFADRIATPDRCLLKLDLEGHELSALKGARRLLQNVEIILTEVRFYDINHNHRPIFWEMLAFLHGHGFETYDFASLSQRPRDMRLRMGDVVFVRRDSPLFGDCE